MTNHSSENDETPPETRQDAEFEDSAEVTRPVDPAIATGDLLARLERVRSHCSDPDRYQLRGRIGRGGQGAVYEVYDQDLSRRLAMKLVLGRDGPTADDDLEKTPPADPQTLSRFLEEAQVTGQLDHPGVVPIHELGLDRDGHAYFTMQLVRGDDLHRIIGRVHSPELEDSEWTQIRALNAILKACEALAYAHSKKVIHRDLKPSNLMVGKYGEVYVMDWGLARVLGQSDNHDLRIRQDSPTTRSLQTDRKRTREDRLDSPLETMDGRVVGTPSYMPPEQAAGRIQAMGPASDVYSMGAVLYQLITGQIPFVSSDDPISARTILARLLDGPPRPVSSLAPEAPPELVAVCEKAMAREIGARYPDMESLATDLRAYLEGRVVSAFESGAWAELRKWTTRNKGWAATAASAIALLLCVTVWAVLERSRANHNEQAAVEQEKAKSELLDRLESVLALRRSTDVLQVRELLTSIVETRPETFDSARYEKWLDKAELLVSREVDYKRDYLLLDRVSGETVEATEEELALKPEIQFRQAALGEVLAGIERLKREGIPLVRQRASVYERSTRDALWGRVTGDQTALDRPVPGLVPLKKNWQGYWEFWHAESGEQPEEADRQSESDWVMRQQSGLVLVWIPPGEGHKGYFISKYEMTFSQWSRLENALNAERSLQRLPANGNLSGFLISRSEMTQEEWTRSASSAHATANIMTELHGSAGRNSTAFSNAMDPPQVPRVDLANPPVAQVRLTEARLALPSWGLRVPTREQGSRVLAPALGGWLPGELTSMWTPARDPGSSPPNEFGLHETSTSCWEVCDEVDESGRVLTLGSQARDDLESVGASLVRQGYFFEDFTSVNIGIRPVMLHP